jgi:hypothetical protein
MGGNYPCLSSLKSPASNSNKGQDFPTLAAWKTMTIKNPTDVNSNTTPQQNQTPKKTTPQQQKTPVKNGWHDAIKIVSKSETKPPSEPVVSIRCALVSFLIISLPELPSSVISSTQRGC